MKPDLAIFVLVVSSLASLILIIFRYDPFVIGWPIKGLFFGSLGLFLFGLVSLIFKNLVVNIKRHKEDKSIEGFS